MEMNNGNDQRSASTNIDFEQIVSNIKKEAYKRIGYGSGRIVYDLGNGMVVKVARNKRGIAQNKAEYNIALENDSPMFAKIFDLSKSSTLLIMEKAEKVRKISYVWDYYNVKSNMGLYKVKELRDICKRYDLEVADFMRAANWGKVNGRPVIVDYGFTKEVHRKYYRRFF